MSTLSSLLRQPLVHFLVLGALIFAAYQMVSRGQDPVGSVAGENIVVTPQRLARLQTEFQTIWQRPPTAKERQSLIDNFVREEVLVREALRLGLDRDDTVLRRRLVQKMEFLASSAARSADPAPEELKAYYEANKDAYRQQGRLSFEQIYLGEQPDENLQEFVRLGIAQGNAPAGLGRKTVLPFLVAPATRMRIDSFLGEGFFDRLFALEGEGWQGPVKSGYGYHLVRILTREASEPRPFEAVRDRVKEDWQLRKVMELRDAQYKALRTGYRILLPVESDQ